MHIDNFIDSFYDCTENEKYASFVLYLFRLPASLRYKFSGIIKKFKLFCTYEGIRYRVTGASLLGDIFLNSNFEKDCSYQIRCSVVDCSEWSDKP